MAEAWYYDSHGGYQGSYSTVQDPDDRYRLPHVTPIPTSRHDHGDEQYGNVYTDIGSHQGAQGYRSEQLVPAAGSCWAQQSQDDDQSLDGRESTRSTPAPSKERRLKINGNIKTICKLLPIKDTTKTRLSQHNTMSYSIVYIRKNKVFGKGLPNFGPSSPVDRISLSEFSGEGGDVTGALTGFMIVTTKDGKLIYLSENVTQYLGHSMVDMLTQGDSIYDVIDKKYHDEFQRRLRDAGDNMDRLAKTRSDEIAMFCQMKVRSQKRQTSSGDQKLMHIKGHLSWLPNNYSEPIFLAICNPLITPDFKDSMVQMSTMIFRTIHNNDMSYKEIMEGIAEFHLGFSNEEMVGESWYGMIHPDDDMRAREKHKQLFSHGHAPELGCMLTIRMMTKYGHWIWLNLIMHVDHPYANSDESAVIVINQVISEQEAALYREQSHRYSPNIVPSPEQLPDAPVDGHTIRPIINDWPDGLYAHGEVSYHPSAHQDATYYGRSYGPYPDYHGYQENGDEGGYVQTHPEVPTVVNVFSTKSNAEHPKNAFMSSSTILPKEIQTTLSDKTDLAVTSQIKIEDNFTSPLTPDKESYDEVDGLVPAQRFKLCPPASLPTPDSSPAASPTSTGLSIKQEKHEEILPKLTFDDVRRNLDEELNNEAESNQKNFHYSVGKQTFPKTTLCKMPSTFKNKWRFVGDAAFSGKNWAENWKHQRHPRQRFMSTSLDDVTVKSKIRAASRTRSCEFSRAGFEDNFTVGHPALTQWSHKPDSSQIFGLNADVWGRRTHLPSPSSTQFDPLAQTVGMSTSKKRKYHDGNYESNEKDLLSEQKCRPVDHLPIGTDATFSSQRRSLGSPSSRWGNSKTNSRTKHNFPKCENTHFSESVQPKQVLPSISTFSESILHGTNIEIPFQTQELTKSLPFNTPDDSGVASRSGEAPRCNLDQCVLKDTYQDVTDLEYSFAGQGVARAGTGNLVAPPQSTEWGEEQTGTLGQYDSQTRLDVLRHYHQTNAAQRQTGLHHLNSNIKYSYNPSLFSNQSKQADSIPNSCSGLLVAEAMDSSSCSLSRDIPSLLPSWSCRGGYNDSGPENSTLTSHAMFETSSSYSSYQGQENAYTHQIPVPRSLSSSSSIPSPSGGFSQYSDSSTADSSPMNAQAFSEYTLSASPSSDPNSPESILNELTNYQWTN